jgi:uncharacterized membrane protein YgcG
MQDNAGLEFALRRAFDGETQRRLAGVAASFLAMAFCAGLAACAEDPKYPSLSKITDLGSILTPEERQKAVEDLQKQDQAHNNDASKDAGKQ